MWLEGYRERMDHELELLAWMQANLINIHIPRGKPRMTVDKLLPKGRKRRARKDLDEDNLYAVTQALSSDPVADAQKNIARKQQRIVERKLEEEESAFWKSAEGKRLANMLSEEA